jgi:hypothetical protein
MFDAFLSNGTGFLVSFTAAPDAASSLLYLHPQHLLRPINQGFFNRSLCFTIYGGIVNLSLLFRQLGVYPTKRKHFDGFAVHAGCGPQVMNYELNVSRLS